jgi:hypothetical protein
MMADGVVVSNRDVVKPALDRQGGQFRHGQRAVGVDGVCVQIPGQPAPVVGRGQIAASGVMTNELRAPPNQPQNPFGPRQPRSRTPRVRSYDSSTRRPRQPGSTSTGRYCQGEPKRSSGVHRPVYCIHCDIPASATKNSGVDLGGSRGLAHGYWPGAGRE